jgi:mono/diheme cytochrome c family protein
MWPRPSNSTRSRAWIACAAALAAAVCWPRSASTHETVNTTVLFDREIVRILNNHCVMCHADKGPAFPLETYEQVWLQKRKVSAAVLSRHMPPWAAVPGYGRFANENIVTLRESQFIVSWMEGLGPRNAGKVFTNTSVSSAVAPQAVKAHADFDVWPLGEPELVRELEAFAVEPARPDGVRRVVIDPGLTSERRVRALEYMPGDRRVVRGASFSIQETGQWIGSWTPWYGYMKLPQSSAFRFPAGAHIVADISYRSASERAVDRGRLGLFFDPEPSSKAVSDLVVTATGTSRLRGETTLAAETALLALRPDVVPGISSIEVSARRPDGGTDVLLFAKGPSADWPTPYILAEPMVLRRGTTIAVTAYGSATSLKTTMSTVRSFQ